jgi:Protein of unknown function (DUF3618)
MDDRTGSMSTSDTTRENSPSTDERALEIRSEIEQTREDLSETVDAIQEKLRPANVVATAAAATTDKVKDMASNAAQTAEDWWEESGGNSLVNRIRNNPIPAMMAGVGLAWLAFGNGATTRYQYSTGDASARREADRVRRASIGAGRAPQGTVAARDALRRGQHRLQSMIQEYPLAVGAAAVLVGASLGMAVPETEQENQLMGEASESARQRAEEAATGVVDRAKEAAADVVTRAGNLGDANDIASAGEEAVAATPPNRDVTRL